jgi:O-antigen ligase
MLVVIIAGVPLIQLAAGQIKFVSDAVLASLYLTGFALAMVAGATLAGIRRADLMAGLCGAFLAAGIVSVGLGAAQWLQLGPIGYVTDMGRNGRPYANLAQPNHLATLLALATIGLLWFYEVRRVGHVVACLGLAWLSFGMVMTQSRTGWLFVIGLAASALWMRRRTTMRTTTPAIVAAALLFFALVAAWQPMSEALLVSSKSLGQRLHPGPRGMLWQALIDAVAASPWVGYGWTQVGLATQAASLENITGIGLLNNSHNLVLDLFLWNGVPIGLLLLIALAWWFVRQARLCRSTDQWLLLAGVSAVFVHAMLEYPLEYAYFLLPVGLMMGALQGVVDEGAGWRASRVAFALPLLLCGVMLSWIGVEYMKVEESARQMRFVMMGIGIDKVSTVPPPDVTLLDAPREFHRFWLTHAKPGMSGTQLDWMREVARRFPGPPSLLRYALAAGLNNRPQEATDTLIRLCFMNLPARCKEGEESWAALQTQFPALQTLPFPARATTVYTNGK